MLRRTLCFLMASAILLAGLALAIAEIVRAEGMQPFLLVGAGLMIGAAGVWLADEVLRQRQENRRPRRGPSK
jgi:ABC-type nickel/cobalt efflux system permease component RcnA